MKHKQKHRKTLQIGFVMDVMEQVLDWAGDTSMAIIKEAQKRGHRTYYIEPGDLFYRDHSLYGHVKEVEVITSPKLGFRTIAEGLIDLKTVDVIFNRKDPPFDLSYLYLTHLLELIESDVFIVNSPRGVRKANEKIYILEFPKWIPPTMISNNPDRFLRFQRAKKTDLILKPLDQKGGEGIQLLPQNSSDALRKLADITANGNRWLMAQKFLKKNLTQGDKRILLLNGKVIGQFGRIPKAGEFRANLSLGGKHVRASLTPRERRLVQALRPKLLRDGLYFVGLDVIDGLLLEINVTSPAGIPEINELEGTRLETQVVDFLEQSSLRGGRRPTKQSRP